MPIKTTSANRLPPEIDFSSPELIHLQILKLCLIFSKSIKHQTLISMPAINGQTILVIGGSSGIGAAVAKLAVAEGVKVFIASSNPTRVAATVKKIQKAVPGAQITGFMIDLASDDVESLLEKLFADVNAATGSKLDHIIYTAMSLNLKPVAEATVEWLRSSAHFIPIVPIIIAKVAPRFLNPSYKSSLIFSSGAVADKPVKGFTIGSAWAGSIISVARGMALDLAPIRVNVVSPGATNTELWGSDEERAQREEYFRKVALLGKCGTAEEVGEAYIYLMKDTNNTGTCVNTSGGSLLQ